MSDSTFPRPAPSQMAGLLRWLPLAVWVVSMVNALVYLDRGWFPHDLGSVAHPAQRVLLGELPHRDFQDVYTGGLAFLNAAAFWLLGQSAMTARWVALAAYALWVPAVWMVARNVAGRAGVWAVAATTVLAAAWTLPMYAEGMPSWYNLFMATFALLALVRFQHDGKMRWLFLAGLAGGVSILFKIVGLYAVAAGLLSLAWMEDRARPDAGPDEPRQADATYRWFITACALALTGMVAGLVVQAMGGSGLVRFGVPALSASLVMAWAGRRHTGVPSGDRFRRLFGLAMPYLAGVAVAVVPFVALYVAAGALDDLVQGVFVLPRRRLAAASWAGLRGGLLGIGLAGSVVLVLSLLPRLHGRVARTAGLGAVVLGAVAVGLSGVPSVYQALWQGLWWAPPFVAVAGAVVLVRRPGASGVAVGQTNGHGDAVFLVLATFGLTSLVEVPFAAPIYFFFAAPLLLLLALSLAGRRRFSGRSTRYVGVVLVLLGFTVVRLNPGFVRYLGLQPTRHAQTETLRIPRGGGLRVDASAREEIETVVGMVDALTPEGGYLYATPDAPELYFLTGRLNPTGTLFEFLDPEPETRTERVLAALDDAGVNLVVINRSPFFSGPVAPDLVSGLQARFPMAREVGRFLVVWKSHPPSASPPSQPPGSP